MQPFLKWAGGKRWLIPKIMNQIPSFDNYYEPLVGSGALFFALEPDHAVISDLNMELINCYKSVRNHCDEVIKYLLRLKVSISKYYSIRNKYNNEEDPIKRAAYFIYLNKTSWNGLYRVNKDGKFNVPVGKYIDKENYKVFDVNQLRSASELLKRTQIRCGDFEESIRDIKRGDLIYFDPPYITTHQKNGFIKYNSVLFRHSDELRLASLSLKLAKRGVLIIASNAAHPLIKQEYDGQFYKNEILRPSLIAGDPNRRTKFLELLITSFPVKVEKSLGTVLKKSIIGQKKPYSQLFNPKCILERKYINKNGF